MRSGKQRASLKFALYAVVRTLHAAPARFAQAFVPERIPVVQVVRGRERVGIGKQAIAAGQSGASFLDPIVNGAEFLGRP